VHVALLAVKVYDAFLAPGDESGATGRASSDLDLAKAVIEANERFEAARAAAVGGRAVRQDEPDA
jgi:hypothetical protein